MDSVTELTEEVAALGSHMFRFRLPFIGELRHYTGPSSGRTSWPGRP
jgi:hypothetical protein